MFLIFLSHQHDDILAVEQVIDKARVKPPDMVGDPDINLLMFGGKFSIPYTVTRAIMRNIARRRNVAPENKASINFTAE